MRRGGFGWSRSHRNVSCRILAQPTSIQMVKALAPAAFLKSSRRLLHRHTLLKLTEPIEDHVDLRTCRFRIRPLCRKDHYEPFAIRHEVPVSVVRACVNKSCNGEYLLRSNGKAIVGGDADGCDLS